MSRDSETTDRPGGIARDLFGSVAAPIQAVLDVLPEASLVVVTTCHSQVVHELAPSDVTVVSIGPFTFEEAEAFYRAMWQRARLRREAETSNTESSQG